MSSFLDVLIGRAVTDVEIVHDYFQLGFGDDVGISVYNEFSVEPAGKQVTDLRGKIVLSVEDGDEAVAINFLGGDRLLIDLRDEAYHGPEALELHRTGEPPVIWN